MFGIGVPELIIILVIVLIIFGAGKLPQIGGAIGKGIKNFKKSVRDSDENETAPDSKKIDEKK
jgi:sec-independent protein translocase protein TatA